MKSLFYLALGFWLTASSQAVLANQAVKLAIVLDSPEATAPADLLTVEFSRLPNVQMLERSEVDRIYREQEFSARNRDELKLGRMLGADGLLLLNYENEKARSTASAPGRAPLPKTLNARLVAVKPGVVLAADRFVDIPNVTQEWTRAYVRRLAPLLPKLAVIAKDAIPVSVVNFRSAIASADAPLMEQQFRLLALARLSREPRLFVLERQKLQELEDEKSLSGEESKFWNSGWLLESIVDQNGYSKEVVTLDVRITPSRGGVPIQFEVTGSRTNFSKAIDQLAKKVIAALQITSPSTEWNAADEAARFYEEAKWALRWNAFDQAQATADAAWALGKQDLECATMRVKARTGAIPLVLAPGSAFYQDGHRANFVNIDAPPDTRFCDLAQQALQYYETFSRVSPEGEPSVLTRGSGRSDPDLDWYQAGIEALEASSRVLQHFNYWPEARKSAAEKLSGLRTQTRAVADLIFKAPSVHASYFVGDRIATRDELSHTIGQSPNIFSCMITYGCLWQEQPEDTIALYRQLMESPVFCYVHGAFWKREKFQPRLAAWNDQDQKRIPQVWEKFLDELNVSTNLLWRMEAKALAYTDASDTAIADRAKQEWWDLVRSNRAELVSNKVELFSSGWGFECNAETEAIDREYQEQTIPAARVAEVFEDQKRFLSNNEPYDFRRFNRLFRERFYSQQQALELLPLILSYKSNLLARAERAERSEKFRLVSQAHEVEFFLQRDVDKIAHPDSQPQKPRTVFTAPRTNTAPARTAQPINVQEDVISATTNIISVRRFLEIPLDGIFEGEVQFANVTSHHLVGEKLLLDLTCGAPVYSFGLDGKWSSTRYPAIFAIAILDLATERWQVIPWGEIEFVTQNPFYHHTTFWRGSVFTSEGGTVKRYDFGSKTWITISLPDVGNFSLFVVNDRLYAATRNLIIEILEDGKGTRILASNRRQPPVSVLDSEDLGVPALFGGPAGTLRVATAKKIYSWAGSDWRELCAAPFTRLPPWISAEGILFLGNGWNTEAPVWRLSSNSDQLEYCLGPDRGAARPAANPLSALQTKPRWNLPKGLRRSALPTTSRGSDLFLLVDHSRTENIVNARENVIIGKRVLPQDGYHAMLLCFSESNAAPQKLYLKFDNANANPPLSGGENNQMLSAPQEWLCFGKRHLYFGRESFELHGFDGRRTRPHIGIWTTSLDAIDQEIERQKKIQEQAKAQGLAVIQQTAQELLDKFDRNRDGVIEGEEREPAFADEHFVATQLDKIDANHNGWVGADELKYFDANGNSALDEDEQTGVEHAYHLLAVRLVQRFDSDGNGLLDAREFDNLMSSSFDRAGRSTPNSFPDENGDRRIDVLEVQTLEQQHTHRGLSPRRRSPRQPVLPVILKPEYRSANSRQLFKAAVDEFWQSETNVMRPLRPGMMPPGGFSPGQPR